MKRLMTSLLALSFLTATAVVAQNFEKQEKPSKKKSGTTSEDI